MSGLILLIILPLSAIASFAVLKAGILDRPNHRSSHHTPTPRGGGLGALTAFIFGLALLAPDLPPLAMTAILACGAGAAAIGLLDDLFTLSEKLKFMALSGLAVSLAILAGPVTDLGFVLPWSVGVVGSALFVFTAVNAINFMDGSDGLMAGSLAVAAAGLGWIAGGDLALVCYAFALAWVGFALLNAPVFGARGRLFAGDVGALGGAMILAGLLLFWASRAAPGSAWLAALIILPVLGDVLLTMAARARAGERLFSPHRAHAYQLLIRTGHSHRRVALIWCLLTAIAVALAAMGTAFSASGKAGLFWAAVLAFTLFHWRVRRWAKAQGLETAR